MPELEIQQTNWPYWWYRDCVKTDAIYKITRMWSEDVFQNVWTNKVLSISRETYSVSELILCVQVDKVRKLDYNKEILLSSLCCLISITENFATSVNLKTNRI